MSDLEQETQLNMFNTRVLKVDPVKLDMAGYYCLRNFFETINLVERKLRKITAGYHTLVSGWAGLIDDLVSTCTSFPVLPVGGEP